MMVVGRRSVYMDRIEKDGSHSRVCEHSPQLPQGFTPVTNITFLPGQVLEATCDFDSTERTEVTHAGSTHHHEMCNLYMMMWSELPVFMTCSGQGTWSDTPSVDIYGPGTSSLNIASHHLWCLTTTLLGATDCLAIANSVDLHLNSCGAFSACCVGMAPSGLTA